MKMLMKQIVATIQLQRTACLYKFTVSVCVTQNEHIGRLAIMSVLDTEVDGSNPGSSMLFP